MFLLAGLGNPGAKYEKTRHNVGFMFLDYLADDFGESFKSSQWPAEVLKTTLWGDQFLLVKPDTFMNRSGLAVARIASYYKISCQQVIIVHDDLDLALGRIKIVSDRGAGGHNGIKSIIENLGSKEFIRIRIGIGRPPEQVSASAFVLSIFNKDELTGIEDGFSTIKQAVKVIVADGVKDAMTFFNKDS